MALRVVVAFRMPPAGLTAGADVGFLSRARLLCVRGDEVGGELVAFSATLLALGWYPEAIEEALRFVAGACGESPAADRRWACGVAEGQLDALSPDGQGILGWGPALLSAVSLAQLARPGDVVVDGEVKALRAGKLALLGVRESGDEARRVRGWLLDPQQPWKVEGSPAQEAPPEDDEPTERLVISHLRNGQDTRESVPPAWSLGHEVLATRIRDLTHGGDLAGAADTLVRLRRARARAEGAPASVRCQASLALALMLSIIGRAEEALLEALDALARARETGDDKAIGACLALLAKLYSGAGFADEAAALRESMLI